jgi:hypothetical protein
MIPGGRHRFFRLQDHNPGSAKEVSVKAPTVKQPMPTQFPSRVAIILIALSPFFHQEAASAFTPTSAYKELKIAEFTVFVHPECYRQPGKIAVDSLERLRIKLEEINRLVPKKHLDVLHKVRIWIVWVKPEKDDPVGTASYHIGPGWLKDNGHNPDMANAVEIPMKGALTADMCFRDQPMFLLHELTHAYHHQVLGHDNPDVKHAFQQAKERKLFAKVARVYFGKYEKPVKAYAMTNDMEFLAEITEAYFGVNDWFPFTWEDLKRHDPVSWKLMEKIWGPLERKEKAVNLTVRNETEKVAVLYWIQGDGNLKEFETIKPGKSIVRPTFTGHRWQVQLKRAEDRYFFVTPDKDATWSVK